MIYFLLYLFVSPFLVLLTFFRKKASGNLIIQTAKIGDYANTTPMFECLGRTDVLIDGINKAFADYDERIETIYCINTYKKGICSKLKLAWILYSRHYEKVYVVMPNSFNLFLGLCCYARETTTLQTYASKWYFFLLSYCMKKISHGIHNLTLQSYLQMIENNALPQTYWKQLQKPLYSPQQPIVFDPRFRIGLSLSAGNKIKTIDRKTWEAIFSILNKFDCVIYIFGLKGEHVYLDQLLTHVTSVNPIVSLLGQVELRELPFYISHMNLYISSDTGNSYIADSFKIPLINFAGPCYMQEQRPIGAKAKIIESNSAFAPFSFIFSAPYQSMCDDLYTINKKQKEEIENFIKAIYTEFQSSVL